MKLGMSARRIAQAETTLLGKIAGVGMLSTGRVFWVLPEGTYPYEGSQDIPAGHLFTTIQAAIAACRNGANDYVMVGPAASGYTLTADLAIDAKNFVHLVGLSVGRMRPRIIFATDVNVLIGATTTAQAGTEIANLDITTSGTTNKQCLENGASSKNPAGTWIHDCWLACRATTAAFAEISDFGADLLVQRCVLGARTTGTHAGNANYLGLTGVKRPIFEDCLFLHAAAAAGDRFATLPATPDYAFFRRCMFVNEKAGTTDMTVGIVGTTARTAFMDNCSFFGVTGAGGATNTYFAPTGMGLNVALSDVFNPALAVQGNETGAADTP